MCFRVVWRWSGMWSCSLRCWEWLMKVCRLWAKPPMSKIFNPQTWITWAVIILFAGSYAKIDTPIVTMLLLAIQFYQRDVKLLFTAKLLGYGSRRSSRSRCNSYESWTSRYEDYSSTAQFELSTIFAHSGSSSLRQTDEESAFVQRYFFPFTINKRRFW